MHMNRRYYENSITNIQQLLDPWGYIIFLKFETTLEKQLMKVQSLTFYKNNLKFLYIKAKVSQTRLSLITLIRQAQMSRTKKTFYIKNSRLFLRFRTLLF